MKYYEPFPAEAFEAWEAQKMEMYENYFFETERKDEEEKNQENEIKSLLHLKQHI